MKKLKVYIAGKVSPNSVFGRHDWRDEFCTQLNELSGLDFINLDPTKTESINGDSLNENDATLIFGRSCFMIKSADLVIVNLTDDISVGGSQEMLIAKYFNKPLIGIAPKGGKFFKEETEIFGKIYKNRKDPFVSTTCDVMVEDIKEAAEFAKKFFSEENHSIKDIKILEEALKYYEENFYQNDKLLQELISSSSSPSAP